MLDDGTAAPDSTAVRTALWRAMHAQVDPPPHVLADEVGLKLAAPDEGWRERQDMHPGFDTNQPGVVASTGVAMYLTREAVSATLRQAATLAPGSTLAMTFMLPVEFLEPADRSAFEWARKGAAASGTPFATVFAPAEMLALAREAGFAEALHVSGLTIAQRYFAGRTDGLQPSTGEDFLVATT